MIMMRGVARTALVLALVAGLGVGLGVGSAAPAWAAAPGTVIRSGSTLVFTAGSATANHVVVSQSGGNYTIQDSGAPINPGAGSGCVNNGANTVVCVATGIAALNLSTLDLADTVDLAVSVPATISGGGGDDWLRGGSGADTLQGNGGNDTLQGRAGSDTLLGGTGADRFESRTGVDTGSDNYNGGGGVDTIVYITGPMGTEDVAVSLDDVANDGFFGCCDNVRSSIENVVTGGGDDTIIGSAAANLLRGNAGNDHIEGRGGNDSLLGVSGNDTLLGGAGFDTLDGGVGTDVCDVGPDGGTQANCEG
jgi:Ca2+-binding RTX toxin-like protein